MMSSTLSTGDPIRVNPSKIEIVSKRSNVVDGLAGFKTIANLLLQPESKPTAMANKSGRGFGSGKYGA